MAWRTLRSASKRLVRQRLDLRVEGADNIPADGPAIIAARHFHHLYDGAVMMSVVPRRLHIFVGLDWVRNPAGKKMMERLCAAASWPVVMRRHHEASFGNPEASRALRHAIGDSLKILNAGNVLLIFPEGYPNIDPGYTPKEGETVFLPFQPGFVRLAAIAAAAGMNVPIVPAGFTYESGQRWKVVLRFGEPVWVTHRRDEKPALERVETDVRSLSRASVSTDVTSTH